MKYLQIPQISGSADTDPVLEDLRNRTKIINQQQLKKKKNP